MELTPFSRVFFWLCSAFFFLQLWQVVLGYFTLAFSFVLWFRGTFPLLWICRSKVSLLLFKLLLDLDSISVCCVKRGDIQEFYFFLDVLVQAATIFENQMLLCIHELQHILVPSLSQRDPLYVFILIASNTIVLLLDGIPE